MAETGVATLNLPVTATADTVVVNKDGSTSLIKTDDLATQISGSGALGAILSGLSLDQTAQDALISANGTNIDSLDTRTDILEANLTSGVLLLATWADLMAISGGEGDGAEVLDSDTGTHSAASGTGYDGATVNNTGRFSWDATWSLWVRIGDTGLSSVQVLIDANSSRVVVLEQNTSDLSDGAAELSDAVSSALTDESTVVIESTGNGRLQSPEPLADLVVTPVFEGDDIDTPVVPVSVEITGKNIVNPYPDLWETGQINSSGANQASGSRLRTIGFIPIQPDTQYSRRAGVYGDARVYLYDSSPTFVREVPAEVGDPDVWVTASNETQMRLWFAKTSAKPTDAADADLQVEASAVPTTFEPFRSASKIYDPVTLYAYGGVSDKLTGNNLVKNIERRIITGTTEAGKWNLFSTILTSTDYFGAQVEAPATFVANAAGVLVGRASADAAGDSDYVPKLDHAEQARGILFTEDAVRVYVLKATIDAMTGATTFDKFQAYLDAYPIEVILDTRAYSVSETVARGLLVLPKGGSVLIDATGGTPFDIQFHEISSGGSGGGAGLTSRVTTLEGTSTSHTALLSGLQTQIDNLVVSGDSSPEAAAARASFLGLAGATLKARLDRQEKTAGRVSVWDFIGTYNPLDDHTAAIFAARDAAEANGMDLVFDSVGADRTLNISRGIRLTKSTRVIGSHSVEIKKMPAYSSDVNGAISIGDTVIPVDNATGFTVGFDVYVGPPDSGPSYGGTRGTITAVDTVGNTITIESYNSADGDGIRMAFADGEAVASTTFPMIYTDYIISGATPQIAPEVIGVNLDGNAQPGEPNAYPCSLIHFDQQHVIAPLTHRCELRNSPADAVSDQGVGFGLHSRNRMYSNAWHGIHIGFTNSGTEVDGNYANGNGSDGMYYCYGNTNTRATSNFFENMPFGFREIGGQLDGDTVLFGNITKNCGIDYDISGLTVGAVNIDSMVSIGNTDHVVMGDGSRRAKISGVARGGSGVGIEFLRSSEISIDVDFFDWTGAYCVDIRNAIADRSSDISIKGQAHGATIASVRIQSSDDCLVDLSISRPNGGADVVIDAGAGQPTSDGTHVGFGVRKGTGVSNSGTNTVDAMA